MFGSKKILRKKFNSRRISQNTYSLKKYLKFWYNTNLGYNDLGSNYALCNLIGKCFCFVFCFIYFLIFQYLGVGGIWVLDVFNIGNIKNCQLVELQDSWLFSLLIMYWWCTNLYGKQLIRIKVSYLRLATLTTMKTKSKHKGKKRYSLNTSPYQILSSILQWPKIKPSLIIQ